MDADKKNLHRHSRWHVSRVASQVPDYSDVDIVSVLGLLARVAHVSMERMRCSVVNFDRAASQTPLAYLSPHPDGPAILLSFLVVCYGTNWSTLHLSINAVILAVLILAKLPEMHGVRLFGLNRPRID